MLYTGFCVFTSSSGEAALIGAVDIGGTKIAVGLIRESGQVAASAEWPTNSFPQPHHAMAQLAEWLTNASAAANELLSGVGVACTGPVDPKTGTVGDVKLLPGWQGFPLAARLSGRLSLTVAIENDADAAALAEAKWGAGRNASRFLYVTISTGIGAGIILDGCVYRGVEGSHPELGHQALDPGGPLCYCGALGCWESLASGPAMARWARANAGADCEQPLELTARGVCDLARLGHDFAKRAVQNEARWLGIGLANLVTIFCPDVVALGGGVMESADLFLEPAREIVRTRCKEVPFEKARILPATLGRDAALLGAARVWQTRFQESE